MKHIKTKIIAGLLAFSCLAMNACTVVFESADSSDDSAQGATGTGTATEEEDLRIPTEYPTKEDLEAVVTKCGNTDITGEEFYFYYYQYANLILAQNGSYITYYGGVIPDYSYSLKSQFIMEGQTWYDYINTNINSYLEYIYMLSEAAKADGISLTDEELAEAEKKAEEYELPEAINYISPETVKTCIVREALSDKYTKHLESITKPTDDEIKAEYEANRIKYDLVDMRLIAIEYKKDATVTDAENSSYVLPTKEAAQAIGENLMNCTTPEEFDDIAEQFFKDYFPDITDADLNYYVSSSTYSKFQYTENYKDFEIVKWAMDPSRAVGDKNLIDSEKDSTLYYAYIMKPAYPNDAKSATVRHILVEKEEDAKKILDEYNASDKTEEAFAALATKYTTDPGSKSTGGLYENFAEGEMVAEFNDWSFDEKRVAGDVEIVKTSYGYHIMYYVSEGLAGYLKNAMTTLQNDKLDKLYKEKQEAFPVEITKEYIEGLKV